MKAKTFERILIALIITGLSSLIIFHSCKPETVYIEYFKQGQILEPDYVCTDTLIVVDAKGLNTAYAPIEQGMPGEWDDWGDAQYDSLFHAYCLPFPLK